MLSGPRPADWGKFGSTAEVYPSEDFTCGPCQSPSVLAGGNTRCFRAHATLRLSCLLLPGGPVLADSLLTQVRIGYRNQAAVCRSPSLLLCPHVLAPSASPAPKCHTSGHQPGSVSSRTQQSQDMPGLCPFSLGPRPCHPKCEQCSFVHLSCFLPV